MPSNPIEIQNYFQQHLGRAPSQGEVDFLNKFISRGELSLGEIGFLVQGLPEAQERLLGRQTGQLESRLAQADTTTLDRAVPQVNARLAALGRQGSSAFEGALAQQLGQGAAQRQSMLAQFYGGGLRDIAGQYAGLSQGALGRGYQVRDTERDLDFQRSQQERAKSIYDEYLNRQAGTQRRAALGGLIGAGLGAGLGFMGPAGGAKTALLGASLGSGVGQNAGGLF